MNHIEIIRKIVFIPDNFELVSKTSEDRNNQKVDILRFQKDGIFTSNGPRVIAIFLNDNIISIKNLTSIPKGKLPTSTEAKKIAKKIFSQVNPEYSKDLSFIRVEKQQRSFIDGRNNTQSLPVLWVKYGHKNGTYNWVTLGASDVVIEMEFDSRWDYFAGRRKTEMWDNDDWVLAHEGKGPQLPAPQALA